MDQNDDVRRLLHPRSIAIVGMSTKPFTAGQLVLRNLILNNYAGEIFLVGRSGGFVDDMPIFSDVSDLKEGVDLAILVLPAVGVKEALQSCVSRKVRSAIVFAAGFAEVGKYDEQEELVRIASEGGLALLGPNCMGYTNGIDGFPISFAPNAIVERITPNGPDRAFAIVSHSGGVGYHIRQSLEARGVPSSYSITSGNEAGLGLADFIEFFVQDEATSGVIVYVEQIRNPNALLSAVSAARAAGKPILMMHPGRSAKAQAAVSSHTGALAGDYAIMRAYLEQAGVAVFDTLDELVDAGEILARFPSPPVKGPGFVTFSGAFCAIAYDFCDELGLEIPPLSPPTEAFLKTQLPDFMPPRNPLDLATQSIWQPELLRIGPKALLDDPAIGSLVIAITVGGATDSVKFINHLIEALKGNIKPVVFSLFGGESPLAPEFLKIARENRIIVSRSPERSLRAIANLTTYGKALQRARLVVDGAAIEGLPKLGHGMQPEWLGKQLLSAIGIRTPEGGLAQSVDAAVVLADRIGFPVAMKAQAGKLAHKTEAGGVLLGISDEAALRNAWRQLHENVSKAQPGLQLDGVLVERMASKGLELMIGAKRDPNWGPVVMVGLGGIWVEALGDVRLLLPDLPEAHDSRRIAQAAHRGATGRLPWRGPNRYRDNRCNGLLRRTTDARRARHHRGRYQSAHRLRTGQRRHCRRCPGRDTLSCIDGRKLSDGW